MVTVENTAPSRLIVLDRDGVINVDKGYVHHWDQWEWCPGVPFALRELKRAGYHTAIVTNQSGVGRGMFTVDDYFELMAQAKEDLFWKLKHQSGYWPTVVCACFHHPDDGCDCRKPGTKFWREQIEPAFGPVDLQQSWMVGDKSSDVVFGRAVGLNTVTIPEDYGSLHHFVEQLLNRRIPTHG